MDREQLAHWQAADAPFDQWLDLDEDAREAWLAAVDAPDPARGRPGPRGAAHPAAEPARPPPRGSTGGWPWREPRARHGWRPWTRRTRSGAGSGNWSPRTAPRRRHGPRRRTPWPDAGSATGRWKRRSAGAAWPSCTAPGATRASPASTRR